MAWPSNNISLDNSSPSYEFGWDTSGCKSPQVSPARPFSNPSKAGPSMSPDHLLSNHHLQNSSAPLEPSFVMPAARIISTYTARIRMSHTILRSRAMGAPDPFLQTASARGLGLPLVPPPHPPIALYKRCRNEKTMAAIVPGLGRYVAVVVHAGRTRGKSSMFKLSIRPGHCYYNLTNNSALI